MSTVTASGTPVSTYKRQPPSFAAQLGFGVMLSGVVGPMVWGLEKFGLTNRLMTRMGAGRHQRLVKNNPFRGCVPTEHDVFVATFAKSGTNWMMQIAHQLAFHGNGEFDHIHSVVAWPDTVLMGPLKRYAIPLEDPSVWRASPEQKRVIKTHFDWDLLPYSEDARYIMVIRDPKDIFVSSYHFFVKGGPLGATAISLDTWFRLFRSQNFPIGGSWAVNTAGYWAQRHRPNVLILSFKSMRRDLRATVLKVADFLNVRAGGEVIDRVCEKSSFEYMKRIDDKFRVWKMVPWREQGPMMRKGTQGGSSELLSPERQRELDEYFMAELKRLGSDFPYEEFCDVTLVGTKI